MKTFYATTPIYYVNDLPHIGHIYTTVVADVGRRVFAGSAARTRFLTGTDEHGQNIEKAAAAQGIAPLELADRVVERYRELYRTLRDHERRFHPHDRAAPPPRRRGADRADRRRGRPLHGAARGLVLLELRGLLHGEGARRREALPGPRHARRPGSRRRTSSSACRSTRRRSSITTRDIRSSFGPRAASTRCVSFVAGGPERPVGLALEGLLGHSVSRTPRATSSTCGSTRSRTTSPRSASARTTTADYREFWDHPGRRARALHRQGHPPVPRRVLARVPAVGGAAAADDGRGPTAGGCATRRRSPSRSATSSVRTQLVADFGPDALRYFLLREMAFGQDANFSDEAFLDALQRRSRERSRQHGLAGRALCRQSFGGTPTRGLHRQRDACRPSARPRRNGAPR